MVGDRDFTDIGYLKCGSAAQRRCYDVLCEGHIMDVLAPYGPLVAGTFPIGIDVAGSDIDIVCRWRGVFSSFADVMS